jgi:hypothetical protein
MVLFYLPQQVCQRTRRPHVEVRGDPTQGHCGFRSQAPRQLDFVPIPLPPLRQILVRNSFPPVAAMHHTCLDVALVKADDKSPQCIRGVPSGQRLPRSPFQPRAASKCVIMLDRPLHAHQYFQLLDQLSGGGLRAKTRHQLLNFLLLCEEDGAGLFFCAVGDWFWRVCVTVN